MRGRRINYGTMAEDQLGCGGEWSIKTAVQWWRRHYLAIRSWRMVVEDRQGCDHFLLGRGGGASSCILSSILLICFTFLVLFGSLHSLYFFIPF